MIEEFYEFLEQKGLYGLFQEHTMCDLGDVDPKLYLYSVDWPNTKEGMKFWAEINEDWNNYLTYWKEDLGEDWYLKGEHNEN